jgi:hypothetical protein
VVHIEDYELHALESLDMEFVIMRNVKRIGAFAADAVVSGEFATIVSAPWHCPGMRSIARKTLSGDRRKSLQSTLLVTTIPKVSSQRDRNVKCALQTRL